MGNSCQGSNSAKNIDNKPRFIGQPNKRNNAPVPISTSQRQAIQDRRLKLKAAKKAAEELPANVTKLSKLKRLWRLGNFPTTGTYYFAKSQQEIEAKEAIKKLMATDRGRLFVTGDDGAGASCLFGKLLSSEAEKDEDFIKANFPNVKFVVWLDAATMDSVFTHELECSLGRAMTPAGVIIEEDEQFLAEEVENELSSAAPGSVLMAIDFGRRTDFTYEDFDFDRTVVKVIAIYAKGHYIVDADEIDHCFEVVGRRDVEACEILSQQNNGGVAKEDELQWLAVNVCQGLPVALRLVQELLMVANKTRESFLEIFNILKKSPSIADLVQLVVTKALDRKVLDKLLVFILFDREELVDVEDLALMWANDAEGFCDVQLVRRGLLRSGHFIDTENPKKNRQLFSMPSLIRDAIKSLEEYREKQFLLVIKEAGRRSPLAESGENLLHLAIRLRRYRLLHRLVLELPANELMALCLETNGDRCGDESSSSQTPLDYFCATEDLFLENPYDDKNKIGKLFALLLERQLLPANFDEIQPKLFRNSKTQTKRPVELMLFYAVYHGYPLTAKAAVKCGASVESIFERRSALTWAAQIGDFDTVKVLISHGADVNAAGPDGETPIFVSTNNTEICKFLLEKGADPNKRMPTLSGFLSDADLDFESALTTAICYGNLEVVECFLDRHNVSPDICQSLFFYAVISGHVEIARLLMAKFGGVDINAVTRSNGDSALMLAVKNDSKEMVRFLIEEKNNAHLQTTTVMEAVLNGKVELMEILAEKLNSPPETAAALVNEARMFRAINLENEVEFVALSEAPGFDANSCLNPEGMTPFLAAVSSEQESFVEILLKKGANPNAVFKKSKQTALLKVTEKLNENLALLLLKYGADAREKAVLVSALTFGLEDLVEVLLLDFGADPNVKHPASGDCGLVLAVRSSKERIVKAMLGTGQVKTADAEAALRIAEKRGLFTIIDLLVSYVSQRKK